MIFVDHTVSMDHPKDRKQWMCDHKDAYHISSGWYCPKCGEIIPNQSLETLCAN